MNTMGFKNLSVITVLMLSATACSMKDRTEVHSVSVDLPSQWANSSSTMNILNHNSSSMNISYNTPTAALGLNNFQCYALNIRGAGINPDPRYGCTNPASGMGIIAGLVSVNSGSIDAMVPAGPSRTIELIGIQSTIGCPLLNDLLNAGGTKALDDLGEPYLIGSTTTDIFDDTAVTIYASFSSTTPKAFQDCGDHNNGSPELRMEVKNNAPLIQAGNCSMINIFANSNSTTANPPPVLPTIVSQDNGVTVALYQNASDCAGSTNAITGATLPIAFPTPGQGNPGNNLQFFVKATGTVGTAGADSFTLEAATTVSGWGMPPQTYQLVNDRLAIATTSPTPAVGTCVALNLQTDNTGTKLLGVLNLDVHNDMMNGATPSSLEIYPSYADCINTPSPSNKFSPVSTSSESTHYVFDNTNSTVTANSTASFYVRNTVGENSFITISRTDNSAEPAGVGINFVPFSLGTVATPDLMGPANTSFLFSLYFTNGYNSVSGIKFGGISCGAVDTTAPGYAKCLVPNTIGIGTQPITIVSGGREYMTQYSFNFGNPPSFAGGPAAYQTNCITANKCSFSSSLYTIPILSTGVNVMPAITGGTFSNCTVAPSLPTPLSLNPSTCTISGNAPSTSVVSSPYIITGTTMGTYYAPVVVTIQLDVQ